MEQFSCSSPNRGEYVGDDLNKEIHTHKMMDSKSSTMDLEDVKLSRDGKCFVTLICLNFNRFH